MSENEFVYVSGDFVPRKEARISALDAGVLLGAGLFETLRTYGGRPFRLQAHLARLRASGEFFRIFIRELDSQVAEAVARLVEANGLADVRVRLTATRGPLADAVDDDEAPPATLIITAGPMTPYPAELYENGATVVVSDIRTSADDPTVYHKTTGYLRNLLALRDAHRARATEALIFNTKGRLAEGSLSNVFIVSGGRLLTPPVEEGLLAGITRAAVLELAAEAGVPAEQKPLSARAVLDSDEMFLTNSIMELLPVGRVERKEIGDGLPGPVTKRLAEAYHALVIRETGQ
ncbi:MAG: aminotransferase class IV [Planctomycetota bacterium]|nr:aminotransferase class IV [Planctomycetota bacterium]